jgi:hypothetical protein
MKKIYLELLESGKCVKIVVGKQDALATYKHAAFHAAVDADKKMYTFNSTEGARKTHKTPTTFCHGRRMNC